MRHEITSAAYFLADLLKICNTLTEQQLELFRVNFEELLCDHYQNHWFPEYPTKGSGYRCIRINHKMDPIIAKAANSCGVNDSSLLRSMFPSELTLWIDPWEVSYRIGENGSICVIYTGNTTSSVNTNITTSITTSRSSSSSNSNSNKRASTSPNQHQLKRIQNPDGNIFDRYSTCKDSFRGMEHLFMDHGNINIDQFATYVSS
ncbi:hypothetical protein CHUAL_010623 [Chamberlinius hualienensis]